MNENNSNNSNNSRKKKNIAIIFIVFAVLSIAYAYLMATSNMNGFTFLNSKNLDVYWEIQSVNTSEGTTIQQQPELDDSKTSLTWDFTFDKPGDYFEVIVDAKNDDSIDAMINDIIDYNDDLFYDEKFQNFLNFEVKYIDGAGLGRKQILRANTSERIVIRGEYKLDLDEDDLPSTDKVFSLHVGVIYEPADETAEEVRTVVYTVPPHTLNIDRALGEDVQTFDTPEEAMNSWNKPFFLKHLIFKDDDDEYQLATYIGFMYNGQIYEDDLFCGTQGVLNRLEYMSNQNFLDNLLIKGQSTYSNDMYYSWTHHYYSSTNDLFVDLSFNSSFVRVSDGTFNCKCKNSGASCSDDYNY